MSSNIFNVSLCDVCGTASHTDNCTSPNAILARAMKAEKEGRTPEQKERLQQMAKKSRTYVSFEKIREMTSGKK
jgi:hypothetical protein